MAGRVAKKMEAHALLLTHFSQRYHPGRRDVMNAIRQLAVGSSQLPDKCVATSYDALTVSLQGLRTKAINPI